MPNKDIPNSKNGQNNYELSHRAEPQKPLESRFFLPLKFYWFQEMPQYRIVGH